MSTILAIETSAETASVALLHNGDLRSEQAVGVATHSQTLLPMMQSLLKAAGIPLSDCDAIAFGAGPGSFTGVRTACGIAQGLAFGAQIPLVPVSTLQAMALKCHERTGATDIMAVLDARMGEVYWAQYRFDGAWQVVIEPTLSAASAVSVTGAATLCGNGVQAYPADFQGAEFIQCGMNDLIPHAAQVALLGADGCATGRGVAARDAEPFYLRNKVALTTSERMAKAAGALA
jgi:tRNA threonylcarbamoyladenosine biosynthesis protein TsaB